MVESVALQWEIILKKKEESWEIQNEIESTSWYATQRVDCSWNKEWFSQLTIVKKTFFKMIKYTTL